MWLLNKVQNKLQKDLRTWAPIPNDMLTSGTVFPHQVINKATEISQDRRTENQIERFCTSNKIRQRV